MNKKIILLLSVLCLIAATIAYYFLYFIKTPEYALNEVRESVKQHDAATFKRHVDLDSIYNKCFDDIIAAESKIHHFEANPLAIGVFNLMKPGVVQLAKEETLASIAMTNAPAVNQAPTTTNKPTADVPENGSITDAVKVNFQRKAHFKSLKIKDLKLVKSSKGTADVSLVVTNTELNKDYALLLKMICNEEEIWEIKEISNLAPTLMKMDAAYKAKRAAANKPIQERLKRALAFEKLQLDKIMEPPSFEDKQQIGVKEDSPLPHMVATFTIVNKTNRVVNRIYYDLVLFTKDKHEEIYSQPGHFDGAIEPGKMVQIVNSKMLNPHIPADKVVDQTDFSKLDWEVRPSYISFTDGHVIAPNQFVIE